jgi:hypothetical protein
VPTTGACSSRNKIKGLLHQCSFARGRLDDVGVAVGVVVPPKLKPEHDARKKLDSSRLIVR